MVRQTLGQTDSPVAQWRTFSRWRLGEAIGLTIVLVLAPMLSIGMPTQAVAKPTNRLEQARPKPTSLASDLSKPDGRADQLAGTVAQPDFEQLLQVPVPPTGGEIPDPSRSGGPVETTPPQPDWLMQITGSGDPTYLPPYPVIRPAQEPAAEQTNVINLPLP